MRVPPTDSVLMGRAFRCHRCRTGRATSAVGSAAIGPATARHREEQPAAPCRPAAIAAAPGRTQTAGAPSVPEHDVAENCTGFAAETAGVPIFPIVADRHESGRAHDPGHRSDHSQRFLSATLPGVHVQQGH